MATITAALVKDLREKTGAGMMDCKNALGEAGGDIEAAIDWLRKKGLAKAAKKSGRVAAEGLVGVAVEANFGVVVEVNSETDFVARNDDFQALVRGVVAVALDNGARRRRREDQGRALSRRRHGRRGHRQLHRHHRREHDAAPRRGPACRARAPSAITSTARSPTGSAASACWSRWNRRATRARSPRSAVRWRCMSPPPARSRSTRGARSGGRRAREKGARREERRQAAARAGQDRRVRA